MRFYDRLANGWGQGKFVCVGLDPDPTRLPPQLEGDPIDKVVAFNGDVIEATADIALAYKPQSAYYEALGLTGALALKATIDLCHGIAPDVPVILDAKRADIGSTNNGYVASAFDFLGADAITVHPYLGHEAMAPFLDRKDKGVIVLCRTSNPGAGRYQDLQIGNETLYEHIARDVVENWNHNDNCALVTGATAPKELGNIRRIAPEMPFLVPGIGTQGGDLQATLANGLDHNGAGLMISSSRGIIYAYEKTGRGIGESAREAALELDTEIRQLLPRSS